MTESCLKFSEFVTCCREELVKKLSTDLIFVQFSLLGVHHGGILPIVREVVEILFSKVDTCARFFFFFFILLLEKGFGESVVCN